MVFHPLGAQTVRRIARRELERMLVREGIVRRQLLVELDDAVVEAVAADGFHPRYGARPLQRAIERLVIEPLARLLIERHVQDGDFVRIHVVDGRIAVAFEHLADPEAAQAARHDRRAAEVDATFARSERLARAFAERLATDESERSLKTCAPRSLS